MRVRTEAKREAILEAAAELFEEVGYIEASMNELVKRLGGSKSTLYGYFPSKDDLLIAVVKQYATAHLAEAMAELDASIKTRRDLRGSLLRFGDRALRVISNDSRARSIHRVVIAEAGHSNVGELFQEAGPMQMTSMLAQLIENSMARGEIRQADPNVTAMQFTAILFAEVTSRTYQRSPPVLKATQVHAMVVRAVEFFLAALAPLGPQASAGREAECKA